MMTMFKKSSLRHSGLVNTFNVVKRMLLRKTSA